MAKTAQCCWGGEIFTAQWIATKGERHRMRALSHTARFTTDTVIEVTDSEVLAWFPDPDES